MQQIDNELKKSMAEVNLWLAVIGLSQVFSCIGQWI